MLKNYIFGKIDAICNMDVKLLNYSQSSKVFQCCCPRGSRVTREEGYNLFLLILKSLTVMVSGLLMTNLQKKRQMIKQHAAMNNFSFASVPLGFQLHGNVVWPLWNIEPIFANSDVLVFNWRMNITAPRHLMASWYPLLNDRCDPYSCVIFRARNLWNLPSNTRKERPERLNHSVCLVIVW